MRLFLAALLLLAASCEAANSYGYSRLTVERTWTVDSDGSPFDLTAAIAINNSAQRVLSVTTDPGMDVSQDPDGIIWLHYQGSGVRHSVLTARAIVDVDYNTNITSDSPVPGKPLGGTNLTEADDRIAKQASLLSVPDSSLYTIRNLVDWVHTHVTYDLSYWGKTKSASEVFDQRRGVCVEYTHLLISMARTLGFETRYVSGYVFADAWQPHAWAEINVPGYGWLPADATFGQAGILDDTHLGMHYAADQSSTYDLLLSADQNATVDVSDKLGSDFLSSDPKGVLVNLTLDKDSYLADAAVTNTRPDFVFGSFSLLVPDGYGGEDTSIMLLRPDETVHRYQGLNRSLFQGGFFYKVPVSASFNDAKDEKTLGVSGPGSGNQTGASGTSACPAAFALPALAALAAFRKGKAADI